MLRLALAVLVTAPALAQVPDLEGAALVNVTAEPTAYQGRPALRVAGPDGPPGADRLVVLDHALHDGAIEVWLAARPAADAPPNARGFVGLAFNVDGETYEAFYLRMTNGRAEDQAMRNHAAQYVAHPDWTWRRLRDERTSEYESYVDLEAGAWTKVRIEVEGDRARLYVHDAPQPTLTVERLDQGGGAVALWIGPWTEAHFADLEVEPAE